MAERVTGAEPARQPVTQIVIAIGDERISMGMAILLKSKGFRTELIGGLGEVRRERNGTVLILDEALLYGGLKPLEDLSDVPTIIVGKHAEDSLRHSTLLLAGADYYLDTDRSPELIAACIKAIERRLTREAPVLPYYKVGDVEIDMSAGKFLQGEESVRLTLTERRMVSYLLWEPEQYHPATEILRAVWGPEYGEETCYLKAYANRLRKKLGRDFIESSRQFGYRIKQGGITQKPNL